MNRIWQRGLCLFIFVFLCVVSEYEVFGQKSNTEIVAFYNLENFFDTIDTRGVNDTEFTPEGKKKWDTEKYWTKVDHISKVIASLGIEHNSDGAVVMGLCEMENRGVLDDLVDAAAIKKRGYQIIHYDSPDQRGIDVALLYRPEVFNVENTSSHSLIIRDEDGDQIFTRDQLLVTGLLNGDRIHFIVNHWPSRYGGEESSRPFRNEAARLSRALVDSIMGTDSHAKIIIMGDLNDDPNNESVRIHLNAHSERSDLKKDELFNATGVLFDEGKGTLPYRGSWNLFDQIIFSKSFLKAKIGAYYFDSVHIYKPEFLLQQEGKYKGYTWRTYVGNNYHGGFSDHLPSYIILKRKRFFNGFRLF